MQADRFRVGDAVKIVKARAMPDLEGTRAVIIRQREWVRVKGRDGEQIYAYRIEAADGKHYSAEEYCLELFGSSRFMSDAERKKVAAVNAPHFQSPRLRLVANNGRRII